MRLCFHIQKSTNQRLSKKAFTSAINRAGIKLPKNQMFHVIRYNDKESDPMGTDFTYYRNKFVKIIVESKTKPYIFDRFMDSLYGAQVANLTVAEEQPAS